MKWINRGHQFDDIGADFVGKEIIIYGASILGKELFEKIDFLCSVTAFVDRNECLQKEGFVNIPVISISELARRDRSSHIVIIAIAGYNGMMVHSQLMHMGYVLGKNCFFYDIFLNYYLSIYALYAKDLLYFPSISFLLTTHCNLNCRGCLNFTSFNTNKHHYTLQELKRNVDIFFSKVDYVEKFHMSGGEPFLYPYFVEILDYIGNNYGTRIGNLYTATNGTIVPNNDLCEALKKHNVFVEIDDYRDSLPIDKRKNDIIIDLFNKLCIRHSDRGAGYWIDLSPESQDNSELSGNELRIWYDTCNNPFASIHDGKLYSCNYDDYAKEAGIVEKNKDDILELDLVKNVDKKEILEFRHGYTCRGYVEFCKKCAGHEMTNKKHIPVAEQL